MFHPLFCFEGNNKNCLFKKKIITNRTETGFLKTGAVKFQHNTCTRGIQKISSICEYCRCSAAVTMVSKSAEFLDSLLRHRRNLQTSEQCLRIVLCVYNV